jgi:hypothetical protein
MPRCAAPHQFTARRAIKYDVESGVARVGMIGREGIKRRIRLQGRADQVTLAAVTGFGIGHNLGDVNHGLDRRAGMVRGQRPPGWGTSGHGVKAVPGSPSLSKTP